MIDLVEMTNFFSLKIKLWSLTISWNLSKFFVVLLQSHSSDGNVVNISVRSTEIVLIDDVVDRPLETGFPIHDSKTKSLPFTSYAAYD